MQEPETAEDWLDSILINKFLIISERFYNYLLTIYLQQDDGAIKVKKEISNPKYFTAHHAGDVLSENKIRSMGKVSYVEQDRIETLTNLFLNIDAKDNKYKVQKAFTNPTTYLLPIKYSNDCNELMPVTIPFDMDIYNIINNYDPGTADLAKAPSKYAIWNMFQDKREAGLTLLLIVYVRLYDRLDKNYQRFVKARLIEVTVRILDLYNSERIDEELYQKIKTITT